MPLSIPWKRVIAVSSEQRTVQVLDPTNLLKLIHLLAMERIILTIPDYCLARHKKNVTSATTHVRGHWILQLTRLLRGPTIRTCGSLRVSVFCQPCKERSFKLFYRSWTFWLFPYTAQVTPPLALQPFTPTVNDKSKIDRHFTNSDTANLFIYWNSCYHHRCLQSIVLLSLQIVLDSTWNEVESEPTANSTALSSRLHKACFCKQYFDAFSDCHSELFLNGQ